MKLYSERDLNEQLDRLYLTPKQKDNVRHLIENITDRYSNQIEKMRCCQNCKYSMLTEDNIIECCEECEVNTYICDKWEAAEK